MRLRVSKLLCLLAFTLLAGLGFSKGLGKYRGLAFNLEGSEEAYAFLETLNTGAENFAVRMGWNPAPTGEESDKVEFLVSLEYTGPESRDWIDIFSTELQARLTAAGIAARHRFFDIAVEGYLKDSEVIDQVECIGLGGKSMIVAFRTDKDTKSFSTATFKALTAKLKKRHASKIRLRRFLGLDREPG